jgi:hypothetical protein
MLGPGLGISFKDKGNIPKNSAESDSAALVFTSISVTSP